MKHGGLAGGHLAHWTRLRGCTPRVYLLLPPVLGHRCAPSCCVDGKTPECHLLTGRATTALATRDVFTQQALKAAPCTSAPFSNKRKRKGSLSPSEQQVCRCPEDTRSPSCLHSDLGTGVTGQLGHSRLPGAASSTGNGFLLRGLSVQCFSHVPSPPAMT